MEEETTRASAPPALEENLSRVSGYDTLNGIGAKPGVPCIAFHDEQPESPTSAYGRYDNALNGDTGRYHIVYVDGMTYNLEYVSDSGPFSSVNLLWTDRAPFQFEQPGWGMMYLIP